MYFSAQAYTTQLSLAQEGIVYLTTMQCVFVNKQKQFQKMSNFQSAKKMYSGRG
jgi:hypothetical protein